MVSSRLASFLTYLHTSVVTTLAGWGIPMRAMRESGVTRAANREEERKEKEPEGNEHDTDRASAEGQDQRKGGHPRHPDQPQPDRGPRPARQDQRQGGRPQY